MRRVHLAPRSVWASGRRHDRLVKAGLLHERTVELPLPLRFALWGGLALGALGCVIGLVVGLNAHTPTAWAASFEIGIPSALLGATMGAAAGSVRLLVIRHRHSASR